MSQNLSSAAVVIGALRVNKKIKIANWEAFLLEFTSNNNVCMKRTCNNRKKDLKRHTL